MCDKPTALHTLDRVGQGRLVEIRSLNVPTKSGGRVVASGYFDDYDAAAEAVVKLDALKPEGTYILMNEPHAGLIARRPNRLVFGGQIRATANHDIVHLRWGLVDIDALRPTGISATDGEIALAEQVFLEITDWFYHYGIPTHRAFSGNGFHMLTPITDSDTLMADLIGRLAIDYSDPNVKVDVSVTNRAQITKFYGTVARKGFEHGERVHRQSHFLEDLF